MILFIKFLFVNGPKVFGNLFERFPNIINKIFNHEITEVLHINALFQPNFSVSILAWDALSNKTLLTRSNAKVEVN